MATFVAHQGNRVGQSDDEITITTDGCIDGHTVVSAEEDAMRKALAWAVESDWPDGNYSAVVWIEDDAGQVIASEEVEILDGEISLPC